MPSWTAFVVGIVEQEDDVAGRGVAGRRDRQDVLGGARDLLDGRRLDGGDRVRLAPRWASPKLVKEVAKVATTGITWNAIRKIVPGSRYLIGMCQGWR